MKRLFGVVMVLALILLTYSYPPASEAQPSPYVLTPSGYDNYINNDTIINLSASPYNIDDQNGFGVLIINASDITLDCNGSEFIGNGIQAGINIQGFNNVTIKNCTIVQYQVAINSWGNEGIIEFNNLSYNSYSAISMNDSYGSNMSHNTIIGSNGELEVGIGILDSKSMHIYNNTISKLNTGCALSYCDGCRFMENEISLNQIGINAISSDGIELTSDMIIDNEYDILFLNSTDYDYDDSIYGNITVSWSIAINVTDQDSVPIGSALINIYDSHGEEIYASPISSQQDGLTELIGMSGIWESIINSTGQFSLTPHTVNVSKPGYLNTSVIATINQSKIIHIILGPEPQPDQPPSITDHSLHPPLIITGDPVLIGLNASDPEGLDSLWANITDSSGASLLVTLANDQVTPWATSEPGTHSITIHVNDTSGNEANLTDTFLVKDPEQVNLTVQDSNHSGQEVDVSIVVNGTSYTIYSGSEEEGNFSLSLPDHDYAVSILSFEGELRLLLEGVRLNSTYNATLILESANQTGSYERIYAVDWDRPMSSALVRIDYDDLYAGDPNLTVHVCGDWDFQGESCNSSGGWDQVGDIDQDTSSDYLEFPVQGFSAFGLLEEDSACGNGECDPGEDTSSCPDDCNCDDGDTRPCSEEHEGICAAGNETCSDNQWSGCPSPVTEVCNMLDDDCDGTVDDVDGASSVKDTKCGCYGGASPTSEACNGLDDDCNGQIDDDSDCCQDGDTRSCGPPTEQGICEKGTRECMDGVWSSPCEGAVYGDSAESCFNGQDDDCDGLTDSDDDECVFDTCPEGEIAGPCLCEGVNRQSGFCCGGLYHDEECPQSWWLILVILGVVILVVLAALVLLFRKEGKEVTWEELAKRYGRRPPPQGF